MTKPVKYSPDGSEIISLTVLLNGQPISEALNILKVEVTREVGHESETRIELSEIEKVHSGSIGIRAGYEGAPSSQLFNGNIKTARISIQDMGLLCTITGSEKHKWKDRNRMPEPVLEVEHGVSVMEMDYVRSVKDNKVISGMITIQGTDLVRPGNAIRVVNSVETCDMYIVRVKHVFEDGKWLTSMYAGLPGKVNQGSV